MAKSEFESTSLSENLVLCPQEFLVDFAREAKTASNRIFVQSMTFEADHVGLAFAHPMIDAANRGVAVMMKVDHWVEMVTADLPNLLMPFIPNKDGWRDHLKIQNSELLQRLRDSGIDLEVTNTNCPLGDAGFALGRNHRKIFIVDDVLYFGGVNISEAIFSRVDFMLKIHDKDIVDAVADLFIYQNELGGNNLEVSLGDTTLLIDGGRDKSIITQRAHEITSKAEEEVLLMTPTTPDLKLARNIFKAIQRGVQVKTFTTLKKDNEYFESYAPVWGRSHAKLLMADEVAIFGSHNFNWYSKLGTQELSIMTSRKSLTEPLKSYFELLAETSSK